MYFLQDLTCCRFTQIQLYEVFEKIKTPENLCFLWLYWNKYQKICNLVTLPKYSQLKIMNIGGNNIESLEPLQNAEMPSLQRLYLWKNRLTRIDTLRKMYVPNLIQIDLSSNFIVEFPKIFELSCEKLQFINLSENNMLANVDQIVKLLDGKKKLVISFDETSVISVMGKPCKKRSNKMPKHYNFPSQRFRYK